MTTTKVVVVVAPHPSATAATTTAAAALYSITIDASQVSDSVERERGREKGRNNATRDGELAVHNSQSIARFIHSLSRLFHVSDSK